MDFLTCWYRRFIGGVFVYHKFTGSFYTTVSPSFWNLMDEAACLVGWAPRDNAKYASPAIWNLLNPFSSLYPGRRYEECVPLELEFFLSSCSEKLYRHFSQILEIFLHPFSSDRLPSFIIQSHLFTRLYCILLWEPSHIPACALLTISKDTLFQGV